MRRSPLLLQICSLSLRRRCDDLLRCPCQRRRPRIFQIVKERNHACSARCSAVIPPAPPYWSAFRGRRSSALLEAWRRKLTLDSSIIASEAGWKGTHNAALSQTTGHPDYSAGHRGDRPKATARAVLARPSWWAAARRPSGECAPSLQDRWGARAYMRSRMQWITSSPPTPREDASSSSSAQNSSQKYPPVEERHASTRPFTTGNGFLQCAQVIGAPLARYRELIIISHLSARRLY